MPCMSLRSSSCGRSWFARTPRATGSDCPPGFLSVSLCVCSSPGLAPAAPDPCMVIFVLALCHTSLGCSEHLSCAVLSVKFALCTSWFVAVHFNKGSTDVSLLCLQRCSSGSSPCSSHFTSKHTLSAVPPLAATHFDHASVQYLVMHLWWQYCNHVTVRRESTCFGFNAF